MNVPGTPYSLRVDIPPASSPDENPSQTMYNHFKDFITWVKPNFPILNYILGFETSDNNKPHMQSIIWFSKTLPVNIPTKYRNWWKRHAADTYQPVSLTKSIKPDSLASYCMKDGDFATTLPSDIVSTFPEWRDKLNSHKSKENQKKRFREECKEYIVNNPNPMHLTDTWGDTNPEYFLTYMIAFSKIYYKIYNTPIRRNFGFQILLENNLISHELWCSMLFRNFFTQ